MAEIGLAASIIGVAGAAAQISLGLFKIAAALGSAGKEVRAIANDSKLFSRVLEDVAPTVRNSPATSWRALAIADDLLTVCREVLGDSQELLDLLKPLVDRSHNESLNIKLRIRWLMEKSKFVFLRERFESLKTTLHLLISTIGLSRETNQETFTSLAFEVQALKETIENNIDSMRNGLAESNNGTSIGPYLSITAAETQTRSLSIYSNDEQPVGTMGVEDAASQFSIEEPTENQTSPNISTLDIRPEPTSRVDAMVVVPYFRFMFAQERIVAYAADVLYCPPSSSQEDAVVADPGTREAPLENVDVELMEGDQPASGDREFTTSEDERLRTNTSSPLSSTTKATSQLSQPGDHTLAVTATGVSRSDEVSSEFVYLVDAQDEMHKIAFEVARDPEKLIIATSKIFHKMNESEYWRRRMSGSFTKYPIYWVDGIPWNLQLGHTDRARWKSSITADWFFSPEFVDKEVDEKFGRAKVIERLR